MKIIETSKIKEKAYVEELENGLKVIIIPKKNTKKPYAPQNHKNRKIPKAGTTHRNSHQQIQYIKPLCLLIVFFHKQFHFFCLNRRRRKMNPHEHPFRILAFCPINAVKNSNRSYIYNQKIQTIHSVNLKRAANTLSHLHS